MCLIVIVIFLYTRKVEKFNDFYENIDKLVTDVARFTVIMIYIMQILLLNDLIFVLKYCGEIYSNFT